jgi:DNA-binding transcriptional MerR regulator
MFISASCSQVCLEQMNEGDGSILSKETRKRKRGSGFRYSSKKDLERSKLKRATKSRGSNLASVTKALSYPCALSSGGVPGSGGPFCLEVVKEQGGDEKDLSQGNAITEGECPLQVSTFQF